ncbi:MAG TPA: hypothetical protein VF446_13500 [Trinickia sp.]
MSLFAIGGEKPQLAKSAGVAPRAIVVGRAIERDQIRRGVIGHT